MATRTGDPITGKRIKMARCGADLSRDQLADLVSERIGYRISDEMVRRIETAERDVESRIIKAIADITGEAFAWLSNDDMGLYRDSEMALFNQPLPLAAGF